MSNDKKILNLGGNRIMTHGKDDLDHRTAAADAAGLHYDISDVTND